MAATPSGGVAGGVGWKDGRNDKALAVAPIGVQQRNEKWKDIVRISGPQGLKLIKGFKMNDYRKAIKRIDVSTGDSVRILRELQEMSQNDLAAATGIPQSTISAIENDRIRLGIDRAKVLAKALRCHPAVLVFPGWDVEHESAV